MAAVAENEVELVEKKENGSGGGGGDGAAAEAAEAAEAEADLSGLTSARAAELLEQFGRNEIPEVVKPWYAMLGEQFVGVMPFMIELSAILAAALSDWSDFGIILAMLVINAGLGFREEYNSHSAASSLKDALKHEVSVRRDGAMVMLGVELLVPGDIIFVKGGQNVPVDGRFLEGDQLSVDKSALTGETLAIKVPGGADGNKVYSGSMLKQGEAYCVVDKTGLNTMIGEAAKEMQSGGPGKGVFQAAIERLVKFIILFTIFIVIVVVVVQILIRKEDPKNVAMAALALLIASVPVALPMVMTVTLAVGASTLMGEKAIVTHLSALQEIASMEVLCSDKTGTLTTAKMSVYPDRIVADPEGRGADGAYDADTLLTFAAVASNADNIDDAIDSGVFRAFKEAFADDWAARLGRYKVTKFVGFNPTVKRTIAFCTDTETGETLMIAKGLLDKVLDTGGDGAAHQWAVADLAAASGRAKAADEALSEDAFKTIAVSVRAGDGPMRFAGIVPMRDPPRHDTAETIARIRASGVGVKMVTGDHLNIAKKTAAQIKLGQNMYANDSLWPASTARDQLILRADGFAQVMPKDKLEVVAVLQRFGHTTGMTGDGVNDAPALAQANIGIAVAGATEAARAAADIILTESGLSPIYTAIQESRRIFQRLRAYVIYRLASTVMIVAVLAVMILGFDETLPALYVIILALFNDIASAAFGYDNAVPTLGPSIPSLTSLLVMAVTLGGFAAMESLAMFKYGHVFLHDDLADTVHSGDLNIQPPGHTSILTCHNCIGCPADHTGTGKLCDEFTSEGDAAFYATKATCIAAIDAGAWHKNNCHARQYLEVCMYLQMSIATGLLIFQCRTRRFMFAGNAPSLTLVLSVGGSFLLATLMCGLGFIVDTPISWANVLYIWIYDLAWMVVLEVVKLLVEGLNLDGHDDGHIPAATGAGGENRGWGCFCIDIRRAFSHHDSLHQQATAYHLATGGMQSTKLLRRGTSARGAGGNASGGPRGDAPSTRHVGGSFLPMHHLAHHLSRFQTQGGATGVGVPVQVRATSK